jgi:hypothetical protein
MIGVTPSGNSRPAKFGPGHWHGVRARLLAAETPDGESAAWDDSDWDEKTEIRVWN